MKIIKIETTIIPQTVEGRKFAEEYADRLKRQGILKKMEEDTQNISILAEYTFTIKEGCGQNG